MKQSPLTPCFLPPLKRGGRGGRPARGFTIIELMVVSAISVLLMTVGVLVYINCLKIFREGQGVTSVFETAKLINKDLHDLLSHVVPVPGNWLAPKTFKHTGAPDCWGVDLYYVSYYQAANVRYYTNALTGPYGTNPDSKFSVPQDKNVGYKGNYSIEGHFRNGWQATTSVDAWASANLYAGGNNNNCEKGAWWLPAFFGKRDGSNATVLASKNHQAGAWGWPRSDYRLDANADDLANHRNLACWFYAEDRYQNSAYTLALDNPNIVLASLKFSLATAANGDQTTQLSFLTHHACGFDHSYQGGRGLVRRDVTYGNMLRAVEIKPYYLDAGGNLVLMTDSDLGVVSLLVGAPGGLGDKVPRCFDLRFTLRNLANNQRYEFSNRSYCRVNPQ